LESGWVSAGVLGSAALAALVLLTVVGMVRGLFSTLLCRWPCALGVASGLAWWLWLWPSVLGWGIVLISLAASFRSGWKRSRPSAPVIVSFSPDEQ